MKKDKISMAINNINSQYINEAEEYSKIIKGNKRISPLKLVLVAAVILCLFTGVVFAGSNYSNWKTSMQFQDGTTVDMSDGIPFRKIPENAPIVNHDKNYERIKMNFKEIKDYLDFEVLSHKNITSETLLYDTYLNKNGTIASISLYWPDFIKENENKEILVNISILNEGAEEGYILPFKEGLDATGGKEYSNTVELKTIGVSAIIYYSDFDNHLNATFVYDNSHYHFTAFGYSEEEFINVLQELE